MEEGKKISSKKTYFYKIITPVLFIVIGILSGIFSLVIYGITINSLVLFLGAYAIFHLYYKKIYAPFSDELKEYKEYLLEKSKGKERKVYLKDIIEIKVCRLIKPSYILVSFSNNNNETEEIRFIPELFGEDMAMDLRTKAMKAKAEAK